MGLAGTVLQAEAAVCIRGGRGCGTQGRDVEGLAAGDGREGDARGTGKTLSACKLARDCGYERAWYFSGDGLYRERLAKIGLGGSFERDFAVQIGHRRKSLLVLDEFQRGIGYKGEGRDLSLDFFEEVVNARYNAELDTVIVANWTQEDFNQFMPDSVKDRVIQRRSENRGGVRWCDWRSFRRA